MKKISFSLMLACLLSLGATQAQNQATSEEKSSIYLGAWVPETIEDMPVAAKKQLENKLKQIITANGISAGSGYPRFIISANVSVLTKDITPTAPPMQAYTLDITYYIGDGYDGKAFSSYAATIKGVGENDTKAYLAALKNIKTSDPAYQSFIDKGKAKIIEYYNTQCDVIIKEAQELAKMNYYDEAIWKLTSVPSACTECWDKAMRAVAPIYQQKIDFECKTKVLEATNIWNANQSWDGAQQAGSILATINPKAACFGEAKALSNSIAKRIQEVDKREWEVTYEKEVGLEKDMIKAYRDVGVAYGNNQPQNVTYKSLW